MAENDNIEKEEMDDEVYILTDEEGKEAPYDLLGKLEHKGNTYLALVPLNDKGEPEDEYVILKVKLDENGEETFVTVDNDEEFDDVADIFDDNLFSDTDYDK